MFTAIAYDRSGIKTALLSGAKNVELRLSIRNDLDWVNYLTRKEADAIYSVKMYLDDGLCVPVDAASLQKGDQAALSTAFITASTISYLKSDVAPVRVVTTLSTSYLYYFF